MWTLKIRDKYLGYKGHEIGQTWSRFLGHSVEKENAFYSLSLSLPPSLKKIPFVKTEPLYVKMIFASDLWGCNCNRVLYC